MRKACTLILYKYDIKIYKVKHVQVETCSIEISIDMVVNLTYSYNPLKQLTIQIAFEMWFNITIPKKKDSQ